MAIRRTRQVIGRGHPDGHTWTPCASYVTTKDASKEWLVERNEIGEFRCHDRDNPKSWCPAWIFSKEHPKSCKHIKRFQAHPEDGVHLPDTDPLALALRQAFTRRFDGLRAMPSRGQLVEVGMLPTAWPEAWKAFIDDVRLVAGTPAAPVPTGASETRRGVRVIVLEDD